MENSWSLVQDRYTTCSVEEKESLFSIGNGYFGFRGFYTEREPAYHAGVFINGFYESYPICYGEKAYGFPEENQVMIDVPDARYMAIYCGDTLVSPESGRVETYMRILDMKRGILSRTMCWANEDGDIVRAEWEHLVSYRFAHTGCTRLRIEHTGPSELYVVSGIAPPDTRSVKEDDPRVGELQDAAALSFVYTTGTSIKEFEVTQNLYRTGRSGLSLMCGNIIRTISGGRLHQENPESTSSPDSRESLVCIIDADASGVLEIEKLYFYRFAATEEETKLKNNFQDDITAGIALGCSGLMKVQQEEISDFWEVGDIEITGDSDFQRALRFNLFQLYQSVGKNGSSSLSAKGLTGSGYEGHYFWDTEIYAMPFFSATCPAIARSLLQYRISNLDKARGQAALLSEKGALYPWRTINGEELSAYFPAGTAQYHINADIIYSLIRYVEITGDTSLMLEGGAEMLFETARLWLSLGFFNPSRNGSFCIHEVTGPDEYSALVNNNFYTNAMAAYHLRKAAEWYEKLVSESEIFLAWLQETIHLSKDEVDDWKRAADMMFLPYDPELGVHLQDEAFLTREPWNLDEIPAGKFPLLLHYHPLVIYRHRVIKQADMVLAMLLLHDQFTPAQKRRNFEFYETYTTGDSSLSACIQGIIALELGDGETGNAYAHSTTFVDLKNVQGNTRDGLHTASMAGSWMLTVYGFAGLRYCGGIPCIYPRNLPEEWNKLAFSLNTAQGILRVNIAHDWTEYRLEPMSSDINSLTISHRGIKYKIGDEPLRLRTFAEFKGVVFDLDGVITSTDMYHYLAWKQMADEQGWAFSRKLNEQLRGVSRRESLKIITDANDIVLTEYEIDALTSKKNGYYRRLLEQLSSDDLLPGAENLLQELKAAGIPMALASASRNAAYILDKLGLGNEFSYVVPAADIAFGKPHPDIFIEAAEGMRLLPDECIGIEDAQAGIDGIKAAGMKSVGIGDAAAADSCDLYADSLESITIQDLARLFQH